MEQKRSKQKRSSKNASEVKENYVSSKRSPIRHFLLRKKMLLIVIGGGRGWAGAVRAVAVQASAVWQTVAVQAGAGW